MSQSSTSVTSSKSGNESHRSHHRRHRHSRSVPTESSNVAELSSTMREKRSETLGRKTQGLQSLFQLLRKNKTQSDTDSKPTSLLKRVFNKEKATTTSSSSFVFDIAKASMVCISVYDLSTNAQTSLPLRTISGFVTEHPKRGKLIISVAHGAIPVGKQEPMFTNCIPYVIQHTSKPLMYGVTSLEKWPFAYIADVFDTTTKKHEFVQLDFLGADWSTDVAVFQPFSYVGDTLNLAPLAFSSTAPEIGDVVSCMTNMWGTGPTNFCSGNIRDLQFQPNVLYTPFMATSISSGQGASGSAVLNNSGQIVGMQFARSDSTTNFSLGVGLVELKDAVDKIVTAVNFTDHLPNTKYVIIMAVSYPSLGISATPLRTQDVNVFQNLPYDAGYIFRTSQSYGSLQSTLKSRDLIVAVNGMEVGPHYDQFRINEAIAGQTSAKILYNPFQQGSYLPVDSSAPLESQLPSVTVELTDDVGNYWTWWFRWTVPPAGIQFVAVRDILLGIVNIYRAQKTKSIMFLSDPAAAAAASQTLTNTSTTTASVDQMMPIFNEVVNEIVTKAQYTSVTDVGDAFHALDTYSLQSSQIPADQPSRVAAITQEVFQMMNTFNDASSTMDMVVPNIEEITMTPSGDPFMPP